MSNISRTWLGIFSAIIVLLIVVFTMPEYKIEPKAIFLSAKKEVTQPYFGKVTLYYPQTAPFLYEDLGIIRLRYHVHNQSEQTQNIVISKLFKLAAKAGGNGIVVDPLQTGLVPEPKPLQVYIATVKVILVPRKNSLSQ